MGFSSHATELKTRNKLNELYLKKGSYFRLKKLFLEASVREGIDLKSANADELKQLKEKIRQQKKVERKQQYQAILISLITGTLLFYLIGYAIQHIFF